MRRESVEGVVPIQIRMAVVRLRRDIGAPHPPEPLQGMMGLQTGFAQRVSVNATKWPPTTIFRRSVLARCHGAVVPLCLVLEFGLAQFRWTDGIGSDREVNRRPRSVGCCDCKRTPGGAEFGRARLWPFDLEKHRMSSMAAILLSAA